MMSDKFTCDDKQTLVSYLYGEIDHETRQAVEAHLSSCHACAAEVTALGDVRSDIGLWVPPDVELDFQIVKKSALPPATVLRPAKWWNTVPAWAQAAAAFLVVAAGISIANVRVQSTAEGFSVSTGWMQPALSELAVREANGPRVEGNDEAWRAALVSLEQQLRTEIRSTRADDARVATRTPADDATLRRVQQLIAESEHRHEQALARRFVEFASDMNMQRRADLVKISQGFDEYGGQLLRQRQMMNNMIRVSATPQQ
jgi:hypothetical protein